MPRRKTTKTKTLAQDSRGRYLRNIGRTRNPRSGKIAQRKFYLGHDEDAARHAAARLEALWKCVERRFERLHSQRLVLEALEEEHRPPLEYEMIGNVLQVKPYIPHPLWCPISLQIAEAIRDGRPIARISLDLEHSTANRVSGRQTFDPGSKFKVATDMLAELRQDFNVIHLELEDDALSALANQQIKQTAERLLGESVRLQAKPLSHQRLHQAIEDYKVNTLQDNVDEDGESTEWARAKVRQIEFVRRNTVDLDLTQVGEKSVVQIIETLRGRPYTLKTGKHCSKRYAANCLKEFKVFLKWLDKNKSYFWVWPAGYEFERGKIADVVTSDSGQEPSKRLIHTNTVPELAELYFEAQPIKRLYLLLALNCGFIQAEQTSLRLNEIFLDQCHPDSNVLEIPEDLKGNWIAMFRGKTRVYGTWSLWPETVAAIRWWLKERDRIKETLCHGVKKREAEFARTTEGRLLITQKGKPVATKTKRTGRLPNSFNSLLDRVVDKNTDFKRLSFKHLRKTGSTLVRKASRAELASVYLAHGKPHGDDDDLEAYADRPFEQMFEALNKVHRRLQPLWDAVPEPFNQPRRLGGKNHISNKTIQEIRRLATKGLRIETIADKVGVHVSTVYRHLPDFMKKRRQNIT